MADEPDETSSQSRSMGDSRKSSGRKPSTRSKAAQPEHSPLNDQGDSAGKASGVSGDPDASYSHSSAPEGSGHDASHPGGLGMALQDAETAGGKVIAEPGPNPEEVEHQREAAEAAGAHHDAYDHHAHEAPRATEESEDDDWLEEEDEGGGPVKSFLEHLEDLRWVIIRGVIAILIAMVVCLAAANKVVELLKEPLRKAQKIAGKTDSYVVLVQTELGGTNLHPIKLSTNRWGDLHFPPQQQAMKLVPEPRFSGTNYVMEWKATPASEEEIPYEMLVSLKNMGPISPFVVALKIALFGGIGLASPFVFFFIGQFIVPALRRKERSYLYRALAIGTGLFCAGVAFCYFALLQIALNAAIKFSRWMNFEPDIWRAEDYISFVVKFLLGMGLSFELPVVLLTLVKLELLDYERMNKFRPYWVVVNLVLAAMLTPPDIVSQLLMAIPLQVLYEISVLIAWHWHRQDQKRLRKEGLEAD